jgi:hypothetical protein
MGQKVLRAGHRMVVMAKRFEMRHSLQPLGCFRQFLYQFTVFDTFVLQHHQSCNERYGARVLRQKLAAVVR